MNFTFTVPEGSTNHGNPNLLCTPAKWYDVLIFFSANYFAHAASVIIEPGQNSASIIQYILFALVLPGAGVSRAVRAISRHAITERKNPLKRAARAGALCMVLKKPENGRYATLLRLQMEGRERLAKIQPGQTEKKTTKTKAEQLTISFIRKLVEVSVDVYVALERGAAQDDMDSMSEVFFTPSSHSPWWNPSDGYAPVPLATSIHGEHWLSDDSTYYLAMVPPEASMSFAFDTDKDGGNQEPSTQPSAVIASSYNLPKLFIGLIQAIWAVITIYRTRGDQIEQYGYAAFGLTVAPYATMSILNSLANMLNPDYPSMFLIRTPAMGKAEEEREGFFKGAICVELQDANPVGRNSSPAIVPTDDNSSGGKLSVIIWLACFCSLIPLAIVGILSGFQPGNSTQMERGFTMSWLVVGIFYGVGYGLQVFTPLADMALGGKSKWVLVLISCTALLLAVGVLMVGGMVVVGKMIRRFGICTLIR
ncbi:hypothetical protein HDV57DRAFT_482018 [Trichoderma longibrachiatum]